jgi:prepilin-type N-terminal cleavage/methylation domain-containing protein
MGTDRKSCPVDTSRRFAPPPTRPASNQAFTLVELAVVLAVLAVLGLLVLPALAATHDRSNRAACQSNLRQIAVAMTAYAADNNDTVIRAVSSGLGSSIFVPIALKSPSASGLKQIGLSTNRLSNNIWACPNRPAFPPGLPVPSEAGGSYWVIGYQYFGGITTWSSSPSGSSRSPIKMSQAKPYWTLAGDTLLKIGSHWAGQMVSPGDPWYFEYSNIPSHRTTDASIPQGGNQVFCDGSVQWIDLEKMYRFISYPGALGPTVCCFYQDPVDFDPALRARLPLLVVTP